MRFSRHPQCVLCREPIYSTHDGGPCGGCGLPVHYACKRRPAERGREKSCLDCGSSFVDVQHITGSHEPLTCPVCNQMTDSLKQLRYFDYFAFGLVVAFWRTAVLRACPMCMRRWIWKRCLWNVIPANLVWPVVLLPWALALTAATYRRGHAFIAR